MADFNKISVKSGLSVQSTPCATLGFNDGYALSKTKYALDNHMLTLNVNSTENISIFYNNGIATCYEFKIKLYQPNTALPPLDLNEKNVNNISSNSFYLIADNTFVEQPAKDNNIKPNSNNNPNNNSQTKKEERIHG